jgi:NarL family two-component system response regulator LiaR
MSSAPIKVLVVDDHVIVRQGIRALLAQVDGIQVVGEASDGEEAITEAGRLSPDVILMDLVMPKKDGIEAIRHITAHDTRARILVLTSFATDDRVFPAIKAGAQGYLLKDSGLEDLVVAIRKISAGEPVLHPSVARKLLREISDREPERPAPEPLTARELEVLGLIARGSSDSEIADHLVIAEVTVRTHVRNILAKLHLANRVQATLHALTEGLTSLGDNRQGRD